ncbi:hypothetical protein [Mycolicibacter heraklionensis]|uniref:hypothetical protein n=1 Tax=Mycolicibacter heraklionensis TaxID=512402 RepID=UPI0007EAC2CE|nr:hypothetical protein [Mycolicibacter heraklionensis]OBG36194.1 hypothetical protein A5671_21695 [Mycolicibacter heraklionensis]
MSTTHPVDSSVTMGDGIPDDALDKLIAATRTTDNLSDRDATIPTMTNTTEVPLPTGATGAEDYDLEDDKRSVRADLVTGTLATQVWALQDREGQLSEVDILLGGVCEQGYSAAQIRELVPALLRAADLADQWTGQPASTLDTARIHATAAAEACTALRPGLDKRGQFIADIACIAAQGIESLR